MNLTAIERTISLLCLEVDARLHGGREWHSLTEADLLHEMVVCMFSSQMVFEVAEAAACRIRESGILDIGRRPKSHQDYQESVIVVLSEPMAVKREGTTRFVLPRFRNRLASLLATTLMRMHDQRQSLKGILHSSSTSQQARKSLVQLVWGFGPKQASLFLRRVGYSAELAVLDTHVLDYLRLARGIDPKPGALSRLTSYESIECVFRSVAHEFGHSVGCVDLAMWVTMRVAKRGGAIR